MLVPEPTPESVPCRSILRDCRSPAYAIRPSLPKSFGIRAACILSVLSVPSAPVCPYRLPKVGYWQFSGVSVCAPVFEGKKDLPAYASHVLFLKHCSSHSPFLFLLMVLSLIPVLDLVLCFSLSVGGGSLPVVASVFTAELSAIVLALRVIFTLPVNSFVNFSDSRSVLSALNSSTPFFIL